MRRNDKRFFVALCNRDQDLRSAMRSSAIWVYEQFAADLDDEYVRNYLRQIEYGNADPTTANGAYWVYGNLAISALEQITRAVLRSIDALPVP